MDATTSDGDNKIIELKSDEPGSSFFDCNINFIYLLAITFLSRPNACYLPSLLFQLVDAARQNRNRRTDSHACCLSNNTRVDAFGRVLIALCHGGRRHKVFYYSYIGGGMTKWL